MGDGRRVGATREAASEVSESRCTFRRQVAGKVTRPEHAAMDARGRLRSLCFRAHELPPAIPHVTAAVAGTESLALVEQRNDLNGGSVPGFMMI